MPTDRTPGSALLEARDLRVGHGTEPVCAPVDLAVAPGRALGLVGANGAGKSTLLQTLVGLLAPLAGTVTLAGREVDERRADVRRDVACVLDDEAFFPSLTGREHLLLTARGHGVRDPEAVVDAEVAAFGLTGRIDALPSRLSSGQRRRLALAAALVRPARLVVLDEPERRLDAGMRTRLAGRLARLRDDGAAVVFACHDADFLRAVADDVLLLDEDACPRLDPASAADLLPAL
ncbi:ABC-type multidrug transport system, ATPase component [Geodermatophilus dictyosporus]|uniref:ABC-type multidrug transport system, ATPase component n=1 Tax=Geodermatophilus dictyosporus TaxID=1523247 RepID=A0A1I5JKJ6_9ACTN|nr:ATP-binding cassette domain-containing protein [Geodermatophilus dictyosporus]SFO73265.1 ABC-type multidrug transport system, ATPase component [Geodermatophilus dictyosporus]